MLPSVGALQDHLAARVVPHVEEQRSHHHLIRQQNTEDANHGTGYFLTATLPRPESPLRTTDWVAGTASATGVQDVPDEDAAMIGPVKSTGCIAV